MNEQQTTYVSCYKKHNEEFKVLDHYPVYCPIDWDSVKTGRRFRETCCLDNQNRRGYSLFEYSAILYQTAWRHYQADQRFSTSMPSVTLGFG
jgi:hypothetical protein